MTDEADKDSAKQRVIQPINFGSASDASLQSAKRRASGVRMVVLTTVIALLSVSLFIVIVMLPKWTERPRTPAATTARVNAPAVQAQADAASEIEDVDETAGNGTMRKRTQALLKEALEKLARIEAMHGESWAKSAVHEILQRIEEGEKAYREQRYVAAQNRYHDAMEHTDRLAKLAPEITEKLVDDGGLALAAGDSAAATSAFEGVLEIDPENSLATTGMARAKTLDQVLALVGQAEGYERLDQSERALRAYRDALKIDGRAPGAAAAIERIERSKRADQFRAAMSQGFHALDANEFGKARAAFERAGKLDAAAAAVDAALKQVANSEASFKIDRHMRNAREHEASERWDKVAEEYAAALKVDGKLLAAAQAKQRAETRYHLDQQLVAYLARPDRLTSAAVNAEADNVLEQARQVSRPGVRLAGQIDELANAIVLARTPVTVSLLSDNVTFVTVYRVGDLGRFDMRELSVLPGKYTAVGKRDGYRDVRVEFTVAPARADTIVTIRCDQEFAFGG